MAKPSIHELPTDRLSTTDELGRRLYLYPADVRGKFRRFRNGMNGVLLLIFLGLPWLQINGRPAVLLDIPHRRFALFGLAFWAHEVPMLFFIVAAAVLGLFLVTAIWGRVWCGWACPQTVFVDGVFRRIERWVEGDAVMRRRLDEAPWSLAKFVKKLVKWQLFSLTALVISHSFLAYFVGPDELGQMIRRSPMQSPTAFVFMLALYGAVLFDFGWFREQFCTIVCPYGRLQSVLMDDSSQTVFYDSQRGEPRRAGTGMDPAIPPGDCVNCYRCVQVCPTGIDIRRGVQLECIACTACVDACDEVMAKVKKPTGLIRYSRKSGLSLRAGVYAVLLLVLLSGFAWALHRRKLVELAIVRAPEAPYQELANARVVNHFKLDLANQSFDDLVIEFALKEPSAENRLVVSNHASAVLAGMAERADLFIEFPKSMLHNGHAPLGLTMTARSIRSASGHPTETTSQEVHLVGPYR